MAKNGYDITENYQVTLHTRIFNSIRDDILNGIFQPGESLVETRLSDELGVSRTPIREALRQLELEGLVISEPNRSVVVKGITTKDIEDIYTIRMMIEGLAARWAAENASVDELDELREALELEEFYTLKNDTGNLSKLDSRFHEVIFKASKSMPLMHTLSTFHHYVKKARNASFATPGRAQKSLEEHRAILQAISGRDPEKAEMLTVQHIKNARTNLMMLLKRHDANQKDANQNDAKQVQKA